MAGELVETDRTWARSAARIEPSWAEEIGAHLVKRTWDDPWWDPKRGVALTEERATLFGLPVVAARAVRLARTDPEQARQWFIQRALVERDWPVSVPPLERTAERIATVRALEERARRRDLLADEEARFEFYESRLPADINGGPGFERWWRRRGQAEPERLEVPLTVLVDRRAGPFDPADYPDTWMQGDLPLHLRYRFEPGAADDGVTVEIPIGALNRVRPDGFDWHIPGYRLELVTALVRALPKAVRRALGPAPEAGQAALEGCGPDDGPLLDVIAGRLARLSGAPVSPAGWDLDSLPPHLRMAFEVTTGDRVLGRGTDVERLRRDLTPQMRQALRAAAPDLVRRGATTWEFGELPHRVERGEVRAYPALVDEGQSVGVDLLESPAAQSDRMWQGTRRLLLLAFPMGEAHLQRRLTNETKLALARSGRPLSGLLEDCATAVIDQFIVAHGGPPYSEAAFESLASATRQDLTDRVARVATIAGGVMAAAETVRSVADRVEARDPAGRAADPIASVRAQVDGLTAPGFVTEAGPGRLRDLLRYLDAAARRLERLPGAANRDAEWQAVVDRLQRRYDRLLDRLAAGQSPAGAAADIAAVRWMIEELRVSLWAQTLGTAGPVSEARISRVLDRLGA
jgi:ATP-dependent helicase HrpA